LLSQRGLCRVTGAGKPEKSNGTKSHRGLPDGICVTSPKARATKFRTNRQGRYALGWTLKLANSPSKLLIYLLLSPCRVVMMVDLNYDIRAAPGLEDDYTIHPKRFHSLSLIYALFSWCLMQQLPIKVEVFVKRITILEITECSPFSCGKGSS